jgi:DNA-binding winged helix-turn-helix (wHTH) protein/tetratricopeptide (TPR) repeat protein
LLRFAGYELDPQRAELRGQDGEAIKLRPKSFDMLRVLATNAGRIVSKQELIETVWPNLNVSEDGLFQCIRDIRTALGDGRREVVRAVSGRGYILDVEVTHGPATPRAPDATLHPPRTDEAEAETLEAKMTMSRKARFSSGAILAAALGVCAIAGLSVAALILRHDMMAARRPTIAVTIVNASNDPVGAAMAANVTSDVVEGLSKIDTIRALSLREPSAAAADASVTSSATPDLLVQGRLQKDGPSWNLLARAIKPTSGEVRWSNSISVSSEDADTLLQQSRLAGGLGHNLALYINMLRYPGDREDRSEAQAHAKIVVEQATAYIDRTSRERFAAAQAMLENALAKDPDNVDLEAALAAHLLRGIQTSWYDADKSAAAERKAQSLLERALEAEPQYLPVLEGYCRFLTATNHFVESLVACAKALTFDPWNGLVRFNQGMSLAELGRFSEALASFKDADRFDTPQVSRWTWLLGAGLTYMLMDRDEEALPWLQRSLAITPGTGRTRLLLAAAYQRLGRLDEAKAAMAKALQERPGSTAVNFTMPPKNTSPLWLEAGERIKRADIAAGLPEH